MIHPHDIEGARPLGDTGLFVGGFVSALDMVDEKRAEPGDFKFFFNHLAWPAGALKEQVSQSQRGCGPPAEMYVACRHGELTSCIHPHFHAYIVATE